MDNILKYRVVILTNDNKLKKYSIEPGKGHADCLEEFAREYNYDYFGRDYLASMGNVIFSNFGNESEFVDLPSYLDDDRLYTLDYLQNWLYDVKYMVGCKWKDGRVLDDFTICDNVMDNFSKEIIQSYYISSGKRKV